jgi:hypothetical protein
MSRFLITGLPRSRTAWWAVVTGALHEPISRRGRLWPWHDGEGFSDSGAAMHLDEILNLLAPRTLIVERPRAEVLASAWAYLAPLKLTDKEAFWRLLDHASANLDAARSPLIKRVAYRDLGDIETVRACLDWLGVAEPRHLEQLLHMNIQSDLNWNRAQLRSAA